MSASRLAGTPLRKHSTNKKGSRAGPLLPYPCGPIPSRQDRPTQGIKRQPCRRRANKLPRKIPFARAAQPIAAVEVRRDRRPRKNLPRRNNLRFLTRNAASSYGVWEKLAGLQGLVGKGKNHLNRCDHLDRPAVQQCGLVAPLTHRLHGSGNKYRVAGDQH